MGSETQIRRERIGRTLSQVIWPATHPLSAPLAISVAKLPGEPVPPEIAPTLAYVPFEVGDSWGGAWSTAWFKAKGEVPSEFDGAHVVARVDLGYRGETGFGGEALVFEARPGDDIPRPVQGINPKHNSVEIAACAIAGAPVSLLVEAAANPAHREGPLEWPLLLPDYDGGPLYRLRRFDLAVVDDDMVEVLYDWTVLTELVDSLGLEHRRSAEIVHVLDQVACNADLGLVRETIAGRRHLWAGLLEEATAPGSHRVTAVGHAHIDSAWLWPIRETKRKCARTFSTAVDLMDRYPEYVFVCSQAQQHAWMKDLYPSLFAAMKEKAAGGQLEPVGSMWVEPDTNLPSGESLVRQLVFGKRFFLENYGLETLDCWLPDAFGYCANLPQILRSAGVRRFLTQKLSWNEINPFPHHTFWWEGIDGSRVLAHCPPTDTYNGEFTVGQLLKGERQFAQHGRSDRSLYTYGFGDGGGGPTEEMLQRARRLKALDPLPIVDLGTSMSFFDGVEDEARRMDEEAAAAFEGTVATAHAPGSGALPIWYGEMYLERHRGVQTTQARSKLGNRRSEVLLREAELWCAAALRGEAAAGVQRRLEDAWQTVLLHQFHDILPGSSIHWVHADSRAAYADVAEALEAAIAEATAELARRAAPSAQAGSILVLNAASDERTSVVEVVAAPDRGGSARPGQETADGTVLFPVTVPGSGWTCVEMAPPGDVPVLEHPVELVEADGAMTLSNGVVSVTVGSDGLVSSIFDLVRKREVVESGERANVFQLHHDLPNHFDAWDIDQGSYERAVEYRQASAVTVSERGPVRAAVSVTWQIGDSTTLSQQIRLEAGSAQVDFVTDVDWQERHRLLKVAFPVSPRSAHATYEVQFGCVERPTHANTSWDGAKFEVPAQRWASLSEPGFGVALLNDCKYGYDVRRNVMRLSLLRGPGWPDPEADAGTHRFSYAVLPHGGQASDAEVVRAAERFNVPLRVVSARQDPKEVAAGDGLPPTGAIVTVGGAAVSAVKRADDGSGDLVVRVYEPAGARVHAAVSVPGSKRARRNDALEREVDGPLLAAEDGRVAIELGPFELVTLRFES